MTDKNHQYLFAEILFILLKMSSICKYVMYVPLCAAVQARHIIDKVLDIFSENLYPDQI